MRTTVATLAALLMAGTLSATGAAATVATALEPVGVVVGIIATPAEAATARKMAPCRYEDGPGPCVWDGRHMGNGVGRSFIVRKSGAVKYVSHKRAHRLMAGGHN